MAIPSHQRKGAVLVSCSENIDETPSGLLLHGIMSSIAEFYSRNWPQKSQKLCAEGQDRRHHQQVTGRVRHIRLVVNVEKSAQSNSTRACAVRSHGF